ncbi:MAG: hypothetical protein GEU28_06870 [Dehalococcoidia bacterium]|nr:hypothetical protein [Dehalococcoidia bacterium]
MNDRRVLYGLGAAVVVLAVIAVVLVLVGVLGDGDDDDDEGQVAATPTAENGDDDTGGDATANPGDDSPDPTQGAGDTPTATSTPAGPATTAIDAVGRFIEQLGQQFAGPCEETTLEEDTGKFCAIERGTSGNQTAFAVGPTFSEITELYFVRPEGGGFVVDHIEPAPCQGALPCPPPVGATVEVVVNGCVNARSEPTVTARINQCVAGGTSAVLSGGPQEADARTWVQLEGLGWISASYINCVEGCG